MIECEYGKYVCSCDSCETASNKVFGSWDDALEFLKDLGFKIIKVDGEWSHICPDCVGDSNLDD